MNYDDIYELMAAMTDRRELSFSFKIKTLSELMNEPEILDRLGLRYIELIDKMLKKCSDIYEKAELAELKLLAYNTLYYPENYLLNNNIDLHKCFSEYLSFVRSEGISAKTADVLSAYYIDASYAEEINEQLLKFLDHDEKIKLLTAMNRNSREKLFSQGDGAICEAELMEKTAERVRVLEQLYVITHPDRSLYLYIIYPVKYNYDSLCIDWYWTKNTGYDLYLEKAIITEKESVVLRKIGDVIGSGNSAENRSEQLHNLYCEFVDGRTFREIVFPEFISGGIKKDVLSDNSE